jgi:DNA-binding GntR family transcriptional regulator
MNFKKIKLDQKTMIFLRMLYEKDYRAYVDNKVIKNPFSIPTIIKSKLKVNNIYNPLHSKYFIPLCANIKFISISDCDILFSCDFAYSQRDNSIYVLNAVACDNNQIRSNILQLIKEAEFFQNIGFFQS